MFKYLTMAAAAAVVFSAGFSGTAQATYICVNPPITINFDDLGDRVAVTDQYPGVTFANTETFAFSGTTSLPNAIQAIDGGTVPSIDRPLVATFSRAADLVRLQGIDVGENGIRIDAYDAAVGGNLLAFDSFIGTGPGGGVNHLLSVSAPGIFRVEFYQPLSPHLEGVLWDDFTFRTAAVPEPSALALLGFGLLAFGIARRRKFT